MNSFEVRQKFLEFFAKNGHTIVPSSSLIPAQDPTLLFANAGMNQFKDIFLGKEKRSYNRATSSQKCVRAGGKHNDLDQVGFTERHLTFFEMLGNFSFGAYFKKEAIPFAWEFLTKDMKLPAEKLHATIFKTDDESFEIWHKVVGLPLERITRLGEADNFWQMGDTGPCGPCTEIYIDQGADKGCKQPGCAPGCNCSRFMEIWNNVFMQFDRQANGALNPLKNTGVDTGMGLERLCSVLQGKESVFETDLFMPIIHKAENLTGISYAQSKDQKKAAFRVLADHVRSCSLLIADGCSPSNEGRGYVLRKIIRRAALFAQKLTADQHLFAQLAQTFITYMAPVFPELEINKNLILSVIESEIERFTCNLIQGEAIFEKFLEENKKTGAKAITGEQVFKLYDTYGFPPELTDLLAREQKLTIDMAGFETEMKKQQDQSGKKQAQTDSQLSVPEIMQTSFIGYEKLENISTIQYIQINLQDNTAWLVTKECPFYAECGGQVSDSGWVTIKNHTHPVLELQKTGCSTTPAIAIKISLKNKLGIINHDIHTGDQVHCIVDHYSRLNTIKNHTATHLLQAALTQVLGPQIKQAGSQVNAASLRFDFTHHQALTHDQIETVENLVNQKIQENIQTNIYQTTLAKAKEAGATAFFGEKYNPENVRVVQITGFSTELCGGIHASSTGIIGCFKITSETALATGTRRITGVTGTEAVKLFQQSYTTIRKLGEEFKAKPEEIYPAVKKLQQIYQETLSEVRQLKKQLYKFQVTTWSKQITLIKNIPFLYLHLENTTIDDMKTICQELEKIKNGFYFLTSTDTATTNTMFFGYTNKDWQSHINLKECLEYLKQQAQFRGGGSPTIIQGSGTITKDLEKQIIQWIENTAK